MQSIENLFLTKAANVWDTMNVHGGIVGFKIPEYQRGYNWSQENVKRLMEDCLSGLVNFLSNSGPGETYTYLGTIVAVIEDQTSTEDSFDGTSLIIVDGQQRLITLSLLCRALIDTLQSHKDSICQLPDESKNWFREEIHWHVDRLSTGIIGKLSRSQGPYAYPKIVKSGDHRMPVTSAGEYKSAVAQFLYGFHDQSETRQTPIQCRRN